MKRIYLYSNEHAQRILDYTHLVSPDFCLQSDDPEGCEFGIGMFPLDEYFDLRTYKHLLDIRLLAGTSFHAIFPYSLLGGLDDQSGFHSWLFREQDKLDLYDTLCCILNQHNAHAYDDGGRKPLTESEIEHAFIYEYKTKPRPGCPALLPQYHVGGFRLDFAVPGIKVCVELDGHDFHKTKEQRTRDAARERWLQLNDWRVIRFTGTEIHRNVTACVRDTVEFIAKVKEQRGSSGV